MPNFFTAAEVAHMRRTTRADTDDLLGQAFEQAREIVAGPYLRIAVEKSARFFRWNWWVLDETDLKSPVVVAEGSAIGEKRADRHAWKAYRRERKRIRDERRAAR